MDQYQHDVSVQKLSRSFDAVVEGLRQRVPGRRQHGIGALLERVSGISASLAANIVARRDREGRYRNRAAIKQVPRPGERAFELSAGSCASPAGRIPSTRPPCTPSRTRSSARSRTGSAPTCPALSAKRFVADRRDVVRPGQVLQVEVLEVDLVRKRISLTLRLDDEVPRARPAGDPAGVGTSAPAPGRRTGTGATPAAIGAGRAPRPHRSTGRRHRQG